MSTVYDPSMMLYGNGGFTFLSDRIMDFAVEMINNRSDILPGIHVNIKRFTDCGSYYPDADWSYDGTSGGFASSIMVQDIAEVHTDVIGVIGTEFSTTARGPANALSYHQIPYCASGTGSLRFSDKMKFPYFWRTMPASGTGNHFYQLIKTWKVTQIALIYERDSEFGRLDAMDMKHAMEQNGVKVLLSLGLPTYPDKNILKYGAIALERSTAKYTLVSGSRSFVGRVITGFGNNGLIGPKNVWIANNQANLVNPRPYQYLSGFVTLTPGGIRNETIYLETAKKFIQRYPVDLTEFDAVFNLHYSFDCVTMMLLGFHKLLNGTSGISKQMLATRQAQHLLNYTAFRNLGYSGLSSSPMTLNSFGDLEVGYGARVFSGDYTNRTVFGRTSIDGTRFDPFNNTKVVFYGGATVPPPDGILILKLSPHDEYRTILIAMLATGLVLCAISLIIVILHGNKPIVRFLSPTQTSVLIFGCSVGYSYIGFYMSDPSELLCRFRQSCLPLSFGIVSSTVICKNMLLVSLASVKKQLKKPWLITWKWRGLNAAAILIEIIVVSIWIVETQAHPATTITSTNYFTTCSTSSRIPKSNIPGSILLGYNICLYICLLYTMLKSSRIAKRELNESATIFFSSITILLIFGLLSAIQNTSSSSRDDAYSEYKSCVVAFVGITVILGLSMGTMIVNIWAEFTSPQYVSTHKTSGNRNSSSSSSTAAKKATFNTVANLGLIKRTYRHAPVSEAHKHVTQGGGGGCVGGTDKQIGGKAPANSTNWMKRGVGFPSIQMKAVIA
ncbi:periplasmic binding protein-like I [Obelidium mucronatum]|nr:periplasmic binding protein-like I [Obelidium mucronatum]